ncbi:MAG: gamma-glutamyltransferase family protein [Actinomycetota bacterium]|nr:gamma-glutamyltransferase family protein [Actinomycetota bacterium]
MWPLHSASPHKSSVPPGIAAGHPATAQAGLEVLEDGGSAADAAVAASLASCVAEVVMTGLAGGGHAIWYDAASGNGMLLDFFVAVPGLGCAKRDVELVELEVPFGTELVHYAVGIGSCAVPGVPAGLDELWRRHGRLPWGRLVAPAIRLAREGVVMPPAHAACLAMLEPVMTMREGRELYTVKGRLLEAGDLLVQPGLARGLELLANEGGRSFYDGSLARSLLGLMEERAGLVTRADLDAYRPRWLEPAEAAYAGTRVLTRAGLARLAETLERVPPLRGLSAAERAVSLARILAAGDRGGHTTNLVTVDPDGNACSLTTSLGLGSGDFLPGLDVHLNSMLGEVDLLVGPIEPGVRMESMMAPTLAVDADGLVLAAGAAGGTRLRSALTQVVSGVLDEGLTAVDAVERPRLHPAASVVHVEPGLEPEALDALDDAGFEVRRWAARHHYFGGVSVIARNGAAADPRRSGAAEPLR